MAPVDNYVERTNALFRCWKSGTSLRSKLGAAYPRKEPEKYEKLPFRAPAQEGGGFHGRSQGLTTPKKYACWIDQSIIWLVD